MTRVHRRYQEIRGMAEEAGLAVERIGISRGGHIEVTVAIGGRRRKVFTPNTPSDWRGQKNLKADLRRLARELAA